MFRRRRASKKAAAAAASAAMVAPIIPQAIPEDESTDDVEVVQASGSLDSDIFSLSSMESQTDSDAYSFSTLSPTKTESNDNEDDGSIASLGSLSSIQQLEQHLQNDTSTTQRLRNVLGFASTLVDAMVEMRSKISPTKTPPTSPPAEEEESPAVPETSYKTTGLDDGVNELGLDESFDDSYTLGIGDGLESFSLSSPVPQSKKKKKSEVSTTSEASSQYVPHEIALLHLEADLLLESIRNGVPPEAMTEFYNKNENANDSNTTDGANQPTSDHNKDTEDDGFSFASSLVTDITDDDGMRREIQTLGRAVTNLRRDLDGLTIQYGSADASTIGGDSGMYSGTMFQDESMSTSTRDTSRFGRRGLRQLWGSAFDEVKMAFKTLRRMQRMQNVLPVTNQDTDESKSSNVSALVSYAPTLLMALSLLLVGTYVRTSLNTMGEDFDPREGFDLLFNLDWALGEDKS